MNIAIIVWLILVILLVLIEAATVALVSVWFAAGAVVGLIAAAVGLPVWAQTLAFLASSAALLLATKPLVKKFRGKPVRTNADRVLGSDGVVTETIDNTRGVGQASISGQLWSARSEDGSVIPAGDVVRVLSISGVKAIVKRRDDAE